MIIGDQVICISPINGLIKNQTYTVTDTVVAFGEVYVRLEGIDNLVRVSRFKEIEK